METITNRVPSRHEALDYLLSFDFLGGHEDHVEYVERHIDRIIRTLGLLGPGDGQQRLLELGASPYVMTLLAQHFLGYRVTPANFFGDYGDPTGFEDELTMRSERFGEEHTFRYPLFNLDLDTFPYEEDSFDVVLCCEILEHLARDPARMLAEIHRVLAPGGRLVLTTPNSKRLQNVLLLLRGHNVYERYSGYGVYGRHNREYTNWELRELLRLHHFDAEVVTDNGYPHGALQRTLTSIGPLRRRRDSLFAVGFKCGETVLRRPEWLYEHSGGFSGRNNGRSVSS